MEKNFKKVKVQCNKCKDATNHEIVSDFTVVEKGDFFDNEGHFAGNFTYEIIAQILRCMGCETITFREIFVPEDDYEARTEKIYPKRSRHLHEAKKFPNVEKMLISMYSQAIEAYNNELISTFFQRLGIFLLRVNALISLDKSF